MNIVIEKKKISGTEKQILSLMGVELMNVLSGVQHHNSRSDVYGSK